MLLSILLKGILLGLAIAAPVGPIALLCIRRTLGQGLRVGLLSGLGAATADGLYGLVAALGLTALSQQLIHQAAALQIVGGLLLIYLGARALLSLRQSAIPVGAMVYSDGRNLSAIAAYSSTLALTLTNPATIFSFMGIFAGLGVTQTQLIRSITLVIGVFTGSAGWWLVLVSGVTYLRHRLTPRRLSQLNRWSTGVFGVLLCGFGLAALVTI